MSGLGDVASRPRGQRRSIRVRLLLLALLPLGIVLPVLLVVLTLWGGEYIDRLLTAKVRADLAVAQGYFERTVEGVGYSVEGLAGSVRLAEVLDRSVAVRNGAVAELLGGLRSGMKLDFLYYLEVDRDKRQIDAWPVLALAAAGRAVSGTDAMDAERLRQLDPA